jgi:photosystem II stability/assembly factor-like uncharacterized protein
MTDDELIERLRRTLHDEAAAITPGPPGEQPPSYPAAYPVARTRWPLALAVAAVAAAAGLLVAFWPGGGATRVGIVAPGPSTTAATPTPSTAPAASTGAPAVAPATTPSPVVGAGPSTTVAAVAPAPTTPTAAASPTAVPGGFAPKSVTFVSSSEGWVAGTVPCSSGSCLALARTSDGGHTWSEAVAPLTATGALSPGAGVAVRFANGSDGWIYGGQPVALWSTYDGGASWHQVALPGLTSGATILALEAGAGRVQVAIIPGNGVTIHLMTSVVSTDNWSDHDTGVPVGAGPVPDSQLVLQGSRGWLLEDDRTVVGGARLNGAGSWMSWTPPCKSANGPAALAASTPADLAAVCQEGVWGPARNLPAGSPTPSTWLFRSDDGGASFQPVGPLTVANAAGLVATPVPSTVVVGGSGPSLVATFDGGHTWQAVYRSPSVQSWTYLGFTTATQGVAIGGGAGGSTVMAMTRDGGRSWTPVSFGAGG